MNRHMMRLMRPIRLSKRVWVLALVGLLLAAGCMSQETLYRDLSLRRSSAYERWLRARRGEQQHQVTLTGNLSIEDALKLALSYNKTLQASFQGKEIARGRVVESYGEALPKLTARGAYTRLDRVPSFDVGGKTVSLGAVDNYSADLEVKQPIYRGGAISAALRAAKIYAYYSDEQVRGAIQMTIYTVARAYYDVLLAQRLYEVNQDAVKSAEAHLTDVQRKQAQGVASEYDVLRAQVDVSNFKAEMIRQQNLVNLTKSQLLKSMGVSQESTVSLSDELTYEPLKPTVEEAVRLAYENRPDLYQAELTVRLREEALRVSKSEYWPTIDAFFTETWSRPDPHSSTAIRWGESWRAGVTVELPLFDGLRREGRIIQDRAALRQSNLALQDTEELALLEIQQAVLSLHDAEELVESQRLNLERATEALRLAEVGYREGINTEVEMLDARAALTRAKGLHYQAIYSHTIARLELQRSMGILGSRAGDTRVRPEVTGRPGHIQEFSEMRNDQVPTAVEEGAVGPQDNLGANE